VQSHFESFRAGDIIFVEGDAPANAFLIESGRVEVSRMWFGVRHVLGELGAGMLLGEVAVIDESPRMMTARALTPCRLMPISTAQITERLAAADPIVRMLLMGQVTRFRLMLATFTGGAAVSRVDVLDKPADADAVGKIRLEGELRVALEHGELEVFLQPIQEIESGCIAGYEALVRWQHPRRGTVMPTEFIRLAEETSLIVPIGDYVLERVCDMLGELKRRRREPLPFIAVNLSARQLEAPELVERILGYLYKRELPPDRLKLEIAESQIFHEAHIARLMARCHSVGMQVALDDFGTGYSNLGPLLTLDFDQIKLDVGFAHALDRPRGVLLVGAIADMARALSCDLVAEGVETREQHEILRLLGCRYAQGWLIGRPVTLEQVLAS
jgi:EAL domain-containing protein (putative c-di-GMP-specific phosphodiesterase class I)